MILILKPNTRRDEPEYRRLIKHLDNLEGIEWQQHDVQGAEQLLSEIYLIGNTAALSLEDVRILPCVDRVVRVSQDYRVLGRHSQEDHRDISFLCNGVRFSQNEFHVFAGLCAVDTREHVEQMMAALRDCGQVCTRMGAYKPRTNPYSFQGYGKACLPYVFDAAGKYGMRVIAMEVTHEDHLEEIDTALEQTGRPVGVLVQIGTRNTQNFELLKAVGRQKQFPVLIKRGFGITLTESLNAAEYLATEGNPQVIFCLRGMKTQMGGPHRNLVDFAHVPVVKRLTRMPICIDPSHSVGTRDRAPDGLLDVFHATAQGIVAGANMALVDFHPEPSTALVDGPQALLLKELPHYLEDAQLARELYLKRTELARKYA